jgi:hypothetical protein
MMASEWDGKYVGFEEEHDEPVEERSNRFFAIGFVIGAIVGGGLVGLFWVLSVRP